MTSGEGLVPVSTLLVITSQAGLSLCDDVMGRRPGLKGGHRRRDVICDILEDLVSGDSSLKAVSSEAAAPSGPQAHLGPGPLECVGGSRLRQGPREAAAPKAPAWPQTVTSFLLAVRRCWGRWWPGMNCSCSSVPWRWKGGLRASVPPPPPASAIQAGCGEPSMPWWWCACRPGVGGSPCRGVGGPPGPSSRLEWEAARPAREEGSGGSAGLRGGRQQVLAALAQGLG